jgi:uncharacterized membrane protein
LKSRFVHGLNAVLGFALVAGSLIAWPGLPDRLPIHFGADGMPDRFADTTLLSWFGLPVLAILLGVGLYLLAAVLPTKPSWINLPDKKRFMSLPNEAKEPVFRRVQYLTYVSVAFLLVILDLVQLAVYTEAHQNSAQTLVRVVLVVAAAGSLVISTLAIVGMQMAMDESLRLVAKPQ